MFTIYPAIDLKDGKCVRLFQGKMEDETIYSANPGDIAKLWESEGASWIHVVDLNGAISGEIKNLNQLDKIRNSTNCKIQFGGGIRDKKTINILTDIGINRVVIGTKALDDENLIKEIFDEYGGIIAISLDAQGNNLTTHGWVETSKETPIERAKKLAAFGAARFIYTQISRDGTMEGPDVESLKTLADSVDIPIIASGGIGELVDIEKVLSISEFGIDGLIIGRALYENKFKLSRALEMTRNVD